MFLFKVFDVNSKVFKYVSIRVISYEHFKRVKKNACYEWTI